MGTLWLVKIHDDDFRWGHFVEAAVWAETPEQAEQTVRAADFSLPRGEDTRLAVTPASASGIVLSRYASS